VLTPCPGCGALFPPFNGPIHRYIGASAACWALFNSCVVLKDPGDSELLAASRIPGSQVVVPVAARTDASLDALLGDAYGVQHHGDDSPQAIQSVAVHLLNVHGVISGKTTRPGWALGRAIRQKGVFHKLTPPALGGALTIRHLFPGGGVDVPVTRTQYVVSVYEAWLSLHGPTVEQWYERHVVPD
jgi:hypothetical protein